LNHPPANDCPLSLSAKGKTADLAVHFADRIAEVEVRVRAERAVEKDAFFVIRVLLARRRRRRTGEKTLENEVKRGEESTLR
jgi:hypothetical protein